MQDSPKQRPAETKQALWIYGPPHVGKSIFVHSLANELGLQTVQSFIARKRRSDHDAVVLYEGLDSGIRKRGDAFVSTLARDMKETRLVWCTSHAHPSRILSKAEWKALQGFFVVIALERGAFGKEMLNPQTDLSHLLSILHDRTRDLITTYQKEKEESISDRSGQTESEDPSDQKKWVRGTQWAPQEVCRLAKALSCIQF